MSETCFSRQVRRVNRNLLLVNGAIMSLLLLFAAFMALGTVILQRSLSAMEAAGRERDPRSSVLQPHEPFDLSRPVRLSAEETGEARLAQLEGQAVTFTDPGSLDSMIPVWFWMERATGPSKPKHPPSYRVSQLGGRPLLILTPDAKAWPAFTGVIRPLAVVDADSIKPILLARGIQGELWPYMLDGLDVGRMKGFETGPATSARPPLGALGGSPLFLLLFGGLLALSAWNVSKGLRRKRNPRCHPIYDRLARYAPAGTPTENIERAIDADYRRGAQAVGRAEITSSWLLINGFWGLDAVPLNAIVWVQKNKVRINGLWDLDFIASPTVFSAEMLDRFGQTHVAHGTRSQVDAILEAVTRGRPWIEVGLDSPLRRQFGTDTEGFIAAVEAHRQGFSSDSRS